MDECECECACVYVCERVCVRVYVRMCICVPTTVSCKLRTRITVPVNEIRRHGRSRRTRHPDPIVGGQTLEEEATVTLVTQVDLAGHTI